MKREEDEAGGGMHMLIVEQKFCLSMTKNSSRLGSHSLLGFVMGFGMVQENVRR